MIGQRWTHWSGVGRTLGPRRESWLLLAALSLGACTSGPEPATAPSPRTGPELIDTAAVATVESADSVDAPPSPEAPDPEARARAEALERAAMEAVARRDSLAAAAARADSLAPPAPLPVPILPGALVPRTRIVAFYGNPASARMGILGELPPDEMLARLDAEVEAWRRADPETPVQPALQMIAVMATGDAGRDSTFRLRMPRHRIEMVSEWASRRDALLILDVQPGHSPVEAEIEALVPWLVRPDVHLALDPEWTMPPGVAPGRQIGSMTAEEINYAIDVLAGLVEEYSLPPKILVVHRFTRSMIQDAHAIRRDPRVQVIINMDGWGTPPQKRAAYRDIVAPEADQFTGFKIFFHNDRRNGSELLTPEEVLELDPTPFYIQYQ